MSISGTMRQWSELDWPVIVLFILLADETFIDMTATSRCHNCTI